MGGVLAEPTNYTFDAQCVSEYLTVGVWFVGSELRSPHHGSVTHAVFFRFLILYSSNIKLFLLRERVEIRGRERERKRERERQREREREGEREKRRE